MVYDEFMKNVRLGKSELLVSQIGFGGIPITRISLEEAEKCIHSAIDHGINFFDTATGYHDSEEKIGIAIKGKRDKFVLASKAPASDPKTLAEKINLSLNRLKTDYIDLYQFHNEAEGTRTLNLRIDSPIVEFCKCM